MVEESAAAGSAAAPESGDVAPAGETTGRILVVEDEPGMLTMLEMGLSCSGFQVTIAASGAEALRILHEQEQDLVVLDVMMPEMDGFEVCRRIRQMSSVPVLLLTALSDEPNVVRGLDAGADEYVAKPFRLTELSARIRALMRRVALDRPTSQQRQMAFDGGRLVVDLDRRAATRDGVQVPLSATEFRLLSFLLARSGRVVSHTEILEQVWGPAHVRQSAYLRTYVGMLRRKIEEDPQNPRLILSSHGVGYMFQDAAGRSR